MLRVAKQQSSATLLGKQCDICHKEIKPEDYYNFSAYDDAYAHWETCRPGAPITSDDLQNGIHQYGCKAPHYVHSNGQFKRDPCTGGCKI